MVDTDQDEKITPATLWYRITDEGFEFNHLQDGRTDDLAPTPKFESQRGWLKAKWVRVDAWLTGDNPPKVVKSDALRTKEADNGSN